MKTKLAHTVGLLVLAFATISAAAQHDPERERLPGAWEIVVTPRVCATGAPITTFQGVYTINPGGTFSGLTSGTGSGGRGREQQGVWEHVSGQHYRFRFKTFLFDAAGVSNSYQILTHDLVMEDDGDSWTSSGISQSFNFEGMQINSGCSTIIAARTPEL